MNDLDLCNRKKTILWTDVMRYIRRWISRKPLQIGLPIGNAIWVSIVTWPMTSRDPKGVVRQYVRRTVGYPSDSLASCIQLKHRKIMYMSKCVGWAADLCWPFSYTRWLGCGWYAVDDVIRRGGSACSARDSIAHSSCCKCSQPCIIPISDWRFSAHCVNHNIFIRNQCIK